MKRISVSVEADDDVVRAGMLELLREHAELILLERDAPGAAVRILCAEAVDEDSLEAMRGAAGGCPGRTVLVVGAIREAHLFDALETGVVTVVRRREASAARMLRAVRAAQSGAGELPPDLLGGLLTQVGHSRRAHTLHGIATVPGLSGREVEVLRLVADGLDTQQIAARLCYSERTIKNVLHGLMLRLHLRNRAHAVAYAARQGYL